MLGHKNAYYKMVKNKSVDKTDFVKDIFTDLEVKAQNKPAIIRNPGV